MSPHLLENCPPREFKRSYRLRTPFIACLVSAPIFASATLTVAADESKNAPAGKAQTVAVDSKRLEKELDLFTEGSNRARLATAVAGLGIGGALVPSGSVLLSRTDGVARSLVIGMIIGGSAQIASAPLMLIPTRMNELRDTFRNRYAGFDSKGGGITMGIGVSTTTIGLRFLLEWSNEETS